MKQSFTTKFQNLFERMNPRIFTTFKIVTPLLGQAENTQNSNLI